MSKATKARVFVPLAKVDEEQRLVYGTITQEVLDRSGEVMDYDTSKPHFEKWSNDIHAASGGLSKGNLRVMHGLSVAGKLTDISFDDDAKSIEVCAKVVDDAEWNKVLEGCYTGFSVGGKYEKRWNDNGVKKYTAGPNEVSLVDNPCVGTATFSLIKADGATEDRLFKTVDGGEEQVEEVKTETAEEKQPELPLGAEPTNDQVVKRAEELAKAAGDGTTWMNHVEAARDDLMKNAPSEKTDEDAKPEQAEGQQAADAAGTAEEQPAAEEPVAKTTPAGVKQVWTASDGTTFEKKADAETHEATLTKAAPIEQTEAQKLADRLAKALNPPTPEEKTELMEDFDRLGKAISALSTPFDENGEPKLEKGMYTVNRFSNVLSDMAALSRTIKQEGKQEGDDKSDATVSADIIAAVKSLGASFIDYASNQVSELLAGMDDDVVVCYHDYYYRASQENGEDALAKDVCSLIAEYREPAQEIREALAKMWASEAPEITDDPDVMSPTLAKRFDELTAENATFKDLAEKAIEQLEVLSKRVTTIEDTPAPRAPRNVVGMPGDAQFFGKTVSTEADKVTILKDMLEEHGPDGMATLLIKRAHQQGGQPLRLNAPSS